MSEKSGQGSDFLKQYAPAEAGAYRSRPKALIGGDRWSTEAELVALGCDVEPTLVRSEVAPGDHLVDDGSGVRDWRAGVFEFERQLVVPEVPAIEDAVTGGEDAYHRFLHCRGGSVRSQLNRRLAIVAGGRTRRGSFEYDRRTCSGK